MKPSMQRSRAALMEPSQIPESLGRALVDLSWKLKSCELIAGDRDANRFQGNPRFGVPAPAFPHLFALTPAGWQCSRCILFRSAVGQTFCAAPRSALNPFSPSRCCCCCCCRWQIKKSFDLCQSQGRVFLAGVSEAVTGKKKTSGSNNESRTSSRELPEYQIEIGRYLKHPIVVLSYADAAFISAFIQMFTCSQSSLRQDEKLRIRTPSGLDISTVTQTLNTEVNRTRHPQSVERLGLRHTRMTL